MEVQLYIDGINKDRVTQNGCPRSWMRLVKIFFSSKYKTNSTNAKKYKTTPCCGPLQAKHCEHTLRTTGHIAQTLNTDKSIFFPTNSVVKRKKIRYPSIHRKTGYIYLRLFRQKSNTSAVLFKTEGVSVTQTLRELPQPHLPIISAYCSIWLWAYKNHENQNLNFFFWNNVLLKSHC